ncbi:MAG TPA: hypothetical protein PK198_15635, partial [Saprospiraceae bacterium]|nr:hypothetical protein [Saprospiraceae bacterium]
GAEMSRTEEFKDGRTPLHTFRADIDYALGEAQTVYGKIGIKVWLCKGEVFGKRDLSPNIGVTKKETTPGGKERGMGGRPERGERRDGGRGDRRDGGRGRGGERGDRGEGGGGRRNQKRR